MIFTLVARSLIIYFVVLVLLRIMGKRQIGEMQPFELVVTIILADLATLPIVDNAIPLIHGFIPLFTLTILHYAISLLSRKSWKLRTLINGRPVIIIGPDGIDYKALQSLNMTFNDLHESIRQAGYFSLEHILYAIVQTNGNVSIMPRSVYAPATPEDLNIKSDRASLPIIVLSEGKFKIDNLDYINLSKNQLEKYLQEAGYKNLKDVLLVTINQAGSMYIQPKKGAFEVYKSNYNGEGVW